LWTHPETTWTTASPHTNRNRVVEVPAKDLEVELFLDELDVGPCHVPPPPLSLFAPSAWLHHLVEDGEEGWEDLLPLLAS